MKHPFHHLFTTSVLCALLTSSVALAQNDPKNSAPQQPEQPSGDAQAPVNAEQTDSASESAPKQPTFRDTINAENTVYDPSLLNEEISRKIIVEETAVNKKTTQKSKQTAQAARAVLESTHDTDAIPTPPKGAPDITKMQGLPGEEFLNQKVEQISELNEIRPGQPMTLREALLQADKENIDLEKARIRIETARAQLKQAWAIFLPNVSASLTYAHLGKVPSMDMSAMTGGIAGSITNALLPIYQALNIDPAAAAGQNAGGAEGGGGGGKMKMAAPDSVSFELTAGVSLINVAGWFQLKMLDEAKTLTELGIADGRQQLLFGVAQAYLAALLCGEVVKVQRIQLKSALDQLTLAQGRFDRGADVRLSVIQAQFAVEKQRQTLIDAIWSYETARDALATLLNVDGLPVPQPTKFQGVNINSDEELEREALENNRTLKINEMTHHVNELNLNAAIAGFLPTLSGAWVFNYTLTEPAGMTAQKYSWTLALSLSIPLFDYSKYGVLDERRAALRTTELERESTINTTKQNVRKAKREYYSALFNVDNAKRQFELAREAMQLTEAAYANGASTFIDVTNARNTVASAAIAYVTAGIQSELSLISLISVLGRDIMDVVY